MLEIHQNFFPPTQIKKKMCGVSHFRHGLEQVYLKQVLCNIEDGNQKVVL